jgi:alkylation response protein AidB-like acyl-CoA dehydrogenase
MVSLLPNPEQAQLVNAVTTFLESELPVGRLHASDPTSGEAKNWKAVAELGWFGLSLDEEMGGSGLGLVESVLLFRTFGRHLLSPSILATTLACRLAADGGRRDIAGRLLAGEARAAIAQARFGAVDGGCSEGEYWLIDATAAEWIVLWDEAGAALYPKAAFSLSEVEPALDWTLPLQRGALADAAATIWAASECSALSRQATLLVAAMLVGVAEGARDLAVAYAKIREQFGHPIGAFQAVKHRCADMAVLAEAAWAQTAYAALSEEYGGQNGGFDVRAARILAADAAIKNGEANIQVHGGIGFTADADPHLFVKRAHVLNQIGGDLRHHQRRLLAEPMPYQRTDFKTETANDT